MRQVGFTVGVRRRGCFETVIFFLFFKWSGPRVLHKNWGINCSVAKVLGTIGKIGRPSVTFLKTQVEQSHNILLEAKLPCEQRP